MGLLYLLMSILCLTLIVFCQATDDNMVPVQCMLYT